jgi:ribulose-5-phosphate 4-epimerase/fuculose-1-phosphate aldolase
MIDEGYTKYEIDWQPDAPLPGPRIAALDACRRQLFAAGLIGHDAEHDVGYGNISVRADDLGGFIISGTQTGETEATDARHYSRVTGWDIDANRIHCRGPVQASSEALTHAAIYELDAAIGAVVHIHCPALWQALKDKLPTTAADIAYGTPQMARELQRLYRDTYLKAHGVAVMGGHPDGLIAFGRDIEQATKRVLDLVL